jgi:hypothetical protein
MSQRPLTQEEIDQSAIGPAFPDLKFEDLLADGRLANRVRTLNPARYAELKQDYLYRNGFERRPDDAYDGVSK